jgi:hypothetical protein
VVPSGLVAASVTPGRHPHLLEGRTRTAVTLEQVFAKRHSMSKVAPSNFQVELSLHH